MKHAFIWKFNTHDIDIYYSFSVVLSKDVTSHRYHQTSMDPTHAAVERVGIGMLPLACVVLRFVGRYLMESEDFHPLSLPGVVYITLWFLILVMLVRMVDVASLAHKLFFIEVAFTLCVCLSVNVAAFVEIAGEHLASCYCGNAASGRSHGSSSSIC